MTGPIGDRIEKLEARLAAFLTHVCSYDERENGCPVCLDVDLMKAELAHLRQLQECAA